MASPFASNLQSYLEQLERLRQSSASEAAIRDAFLQFLRNAFPQLSETEPFWLEKYVPALRVRGGFADALYGDLIFEFKRKLDDASRNEGKEQLHQYLLNQKHPDRYFGILTDGESLEVYAMRDGELAKVDELRLSVEKAEECKLWLDCYLFHEKHLVPTANDVAFRFGERSPTFGRSLQLLRSAWQKAKNEPAVQTKFAEWQSLLSIVYGSAVGDDELFLRHTYLALFARVLAFVSLQRRAPRDYELMGLVTGETFERLGLENFVTDDFFAWVVNEEQITRSLLHSLATRLTVSYNLSAINEDLLKELYQELVDPKTRHDLGEFYTPDWLAELTLRQAKFPQVLSPQCPVPSLLDPACGSGTFLFIAIRLLREAGFKGSNLVEFCERNLAGIDVHPLAVTIARTNFVLALGDDLRHYGKGLHVPIYMADSLSVPENYGRQQIVSVPVDIGYLAKIAKKCQRELPTAFNLPTDLSEERLNATIDALLELSDPSISENDARNGLKAKLADLDIPIEQIGFWQSNLRLMRWLLQPPVTDTVWLFLLKNAYRPALFAKRKFAFVVGNPPWLSYRYIQRRDYQDKVRQLVLQRYKLLAKEDAHLFTQMELATLFFAFCAEHYLADGGTLAFVMPRSILTGAKQHEEFRKQFVATARLLIDCERVNPLFNVPSCVVIWKRDKGKQKGKIPMLALQGDLPFRNASLESLSKLKRTKTTFVLPVALGKSPYFDQVKQGATIVPRCLWFVRPYQKALVIDRRRPQLETDTKIETQAKKPWKGIRLQGSVEAEFLFATLLSDDMLPFGWRELSLVVLPLDISNRRLINDIEAIRKGKMGLAKWLREAEGIWKQNRKSQEELLDYLNWQGKLTAQQPVGVFKVLYNTSGTHLCSCVIDTRDISKWQVYDLQVKGFVADTKTYWLETENDDEAHYLCAVLNAPIVDEYIKPFQPKGAFGAQKGRGERDIHRRPFEVLPIPLFSKKDERHLRLAELSKRCHEKVAAMVANADNKFLSQPIGRLRQIVRQDLQAELDEIERLVAQLLGLP
ncbi:MAG: SAM-dependent methyltransferase [Armatimonadetes bacterium]|nr:SAM-dependent methyltransferase [Armatimonadota bacterium]